MPEEIHLVGRGRAAQGRHGGAPASVWSGDPTALTGGRGAAMPVERV